MPSIMRNSKLYSGTAAKASQLEVTDTEGVVVAKGGLTTTQKIIDWITNKVLSLNDDLTNIGANVPVTRTGSSNVNIKARRIGTMLLLNGYFVVPAGSYTGQQTSLFSLGYYTDTLPFLQALNDAAQYILRVNADGNVCFNASITLPQNIYLFVSDCVIF